MLSLDAWRSRGRMLATPDGRIFVVHASGPANRAGATPLVLLHGFPTASWDFARVFEAQSAVREVLTFDFLGYGFSDKPADAAYSLMEQADVALLAMRDAGIRRAHVWAHDMGTSVATELCARRERGLLPFEMASLVLMNGSVHIDLAHLTVGQRLLKSKLGPLFARMNNARTFKAQMRRIVNKPLAEEELVGMWSLVSRQDGARVLPTLIGYTRERTRFRKRWIGALERLDLPALVAWGEQDPVAVLAIADALAKEIPDAKMATWPELGHYPQVEDAARVVDTVAPFLAQHDG